MAASAGLMAMGVVAGVRIAAPLPGGLVPRAGVPDTTSEILQ